MKDYIAYLQFDDICQEELITLFNDDINNNRKKVVVTPNLDGMRIAYKDSTICNYINSADYVTIDGKPVLWIAKTLKKKQFKNKISGSDLSIRVLEEANKYCHSITIFGGAEGVAEKAKENINLKYPNIKVINTICPEFRYEKKPEKVREYIEKINEGNPNYVFLCTGFPKTERFFFENYELFGSSIYLCVGATVDFIAGNIKRAPKWMSDHGLEWLYRLTKDFRRLFTRYFKDGLFLFKILFLCIFTNKYKKKK